RERRRSGDEAAALLVQHEDAGDLGQAVDGPKEAIGRRVHDVDIIGGRMGDVDARGLAMDRRVIEATFPSMRAKLDVAQEAEAHRGACSNLALPSTLRRQYV